MRKFLVISDKSRKSLSCRLFRKVFEHENFRFSSSDEVAGFIERQTPDFLYLDLHDEFQTDNWSAEFEKIRRIDHLILTMFNLNSFKTFVLRLMPFSTFDDMIETLFENKAIKRLEQMLVRRTTSK